MTKQEIRKNIKDAKRHFSQNELREMSLSVIQQLLPHDRILNADIVYAYYSLPDEVYTHELIDKLAAMGKCVLLPRVVEDADTPTLTWHHYESAADLAVGSYGIMEPVTPVVDVSGVEKSGVVIVPGVAFDGNGNRLGRGRGYYDRFLAENTEVYKIGICFNFQVVEHVPTDEYDVRMDEIVFG